MSEENKELTVKSSEDEDITEMVEEKAPLPTKSRKVKYDGSMELSEFYTLSHMISIVSRIEKIREDLYKNLSAIDIEKTFNEVTYPLEDINPLIVRKPICVCSLKVCTCVNKLLKNKSDTRKSVCLLVYGDGEVCDDYVKTFNINRQTNIDKYHKILKLKNNDDTAFQLLSISYEELFVNCPYLPVDSNEYAVFVERVFQNIMTIFHRDIGHKAYQWICSMFKTYNFCEGKSLQIEPYFTPAWNIFGRVENDVSESMINILRFTNNKDYRYYTGGHSRAMASDIDYGFIKEIIDVFVKDGKIVPDRKIILQIEAPDGRWTQSRDNMFYRYSDIKIGLSVKGKVQLGELPAHAVARESYEEIGMEFTRQELATMQKVTKWGNLSLFKIDITHLGKKPKNSF